MQEVQSQGDVGFGGCSVVGSGVDGTGEEKKYGRLSWEAMLASIRAMV
jgi:hypothetical protein